jgi:hypothetical protein
MLFNKRPQGMYRWIDPRERDDERLVFCVSQGISRVAAFKVHSKDVTNVSEDIIAELCTSVLSLSGVWSPSVLMQI